MTLPLAILNLILTILCEVFIAVMVGITNRLRLIGIVLINIITNSLLSLIIYFNARAGLFDYFWLLIILEVAVFVLEALMFAYFLKLKIKRAFAFSLLLNCFSFFLGLIIIVLTSVVLRSYNIL